MSCNRKISLLKLGLSVISLILLFNSAAYAQNETFRHISSRDGLPSGFIWTMEQDSKGFIWIGTNAGLSKYDGYSYTNYRFDRNDSTSISSQLVLAILEFDETTFFIGTGSGLDVYDPVSEDFRRITTPDSIPDLNSVNELLLVNQSSMWLAAGPGLYHLNPSTINSETLEIEFYEIPGFDEETDPALQSLAFDSDSVLWIGSNDYLYKFDVDKKEYIELGEVTSAADRILRGTIWEVLNTPNGDVLITSTTGLAIKRSGENRIEAIDQLGEFSQDELSAASFQSMTLDSKGKIWLGTGTLGAIHWDPVSGEVISYRADEDDDNTINSDDVHYAFEDSQGHVWFGYHFLGISMMYNRSWKYTIEKVFPDEDENFTGNRISTSDQDENGNIWFGSLGGLIKYSADASVLFDPPGDGPSTVGLVKVSGDKVFGYRNSSANQPAPFIFNTNTEEYQMLDIPLGTGSIPITIAETKDRYFVATNTTDLLSYSKSTGEFSTFPVPQSSEVAQENQLNFTFPYTDSQGNLLVFGIKVNTTTNALDWDGFVFNPETESFINSNLEVPDATVSFRPPEVSEYQPGVVWINVTEGIIRQDFLTGESELLFQNENGALGESNGVILEDSNGYLWMNNQTGIMRLDPVTESITYYELEEERFSANGWPEELDNGEIIYPGNGGFLRFNPDQLQDEDPITDIHLTDLQAGDQQFNTLYSNNSEYDISSGNNNISITYTGLNYKDPAFTRYRYQLEGYNDDWNNVGTQRRVFLANLPPGQYTFRVQAASRFGSFNGPIAEASFKIMPPWWRTIPAYILYFLIVIGIVFTFDRVQRKRLLSKERERAREKELQQAKEIEKAYENLKAAKEQLVQQEKLASLGQLTAGIAHEIKNPLNFVNNFSDLNMELIDEAKEEIESVRAGGHPPQLDKSLSDILDMLDDIEANLRKIHEHGSRADGIVKSMLLHSRGGSGEKESTDINDLVKEYVNLAFHGMRAGKNPINVDIDLNLDENLKELPVIKEDFSRVILNLCNNAFDAMRAKVIGQSDKSTYRPKLAVQTKSKNGNVIIEIADNGPGIPDEIKDKIMQPFFTTKKGTEGTGLGLSITNDIINAHGGELDIKSKKGEGSKFSIQLKQIK